MIVAASPVGGELESGAGKKIRAGLEQALTSFFCKGPGYKYFHLCGPDHLS